MPSLLVVHGAIGSAAQVDPLRDALVAAFPHRRIRNVELPGHGRSPLAEGSSFTMTTFAEALGAAADAAATDSRPVVFGYSMGGYAALLREALAPGSFAAIVTLGTMLEWSPAIAAAAAARLAPHVLRARLPAFADQLAVRHAGAGGWETVLGRTAQLLTGLGAAPALTDVHLASITCPVSLLVGERDDSVSIDATAALAARMHRATVTPLPGVPHPIEKVPSSVIIEALRAVDELPRR
jgi:pimeloyl-ACP methyl ester carboxylesterase